MLVSSSKDHGSVAVGGSDACARLRSCREVVGNQFLTAAPGIGRPQGVPLGEVVSARRLGRRCFPNVVSKNPRMAAILDLIGMVAHTATTVLIEGETGTGKEQVARAIHQASRARLGPLVAVTCGALPEQLLESELFGHEKGAFTGAVGQRKGRFELADRGTLFLDEVGDIPPAMQGKLLRVLQERRVRAGRRHPEHCGGRAGRRRHQPRPARDGPGRDVPRGPLLPAERRQDRPPGSARCGRRTSPCSPRTSPKSTPGPGNRLRRYPQRAWRSWWATVGRETFASWRTPSSGPASPPGATLRPEDLPPEVVRAEQGEDARSHRLDTAPPRGAGGRNGPRRGRLPPQGHETQ